MSAAAVEVFHAARAALGEGPCWDPARQELLWVDMLAGALHVTGATCSTAYAVGPLPSAAVPIAGAADGDAGAPDAGAAGAGAAGAGAADGDAGDMLLALGAGLARLVRGGPDDGAVVPLAALPGTTDGGGADPAVVRVNDAKVDPRGRLWVGALPRDMAPGGGTLNRLGDDGRLTRVLDGLDVPNGLGWSPDGATLYLVDSPRRTIRRHAFDRERGELLAPDGPAIDTSARPGQPDGLALDADGNLWVAFWDGAAVRCYSPRGALLEELRLPARRPTSCAFGGPGLRELLITSSCHGYDAAELAAEPAAGAVLIARPGVAGMPTTPARVG